jgi:quercetin dioxygenase-like cupin family protein
VRNLSELPWEEYIPHKKVYIKKLLENEQVTEIYARIDPGGETIPHFHSGTEAFFILRGVGEMITNKQKVTPLKSEDSIQVPGGTYHQVRNLGNEPMYIFSVFIPGFSTQTHSFSEGQSKKEKENV